MKGFLIFIEGESAPTVVHDSDEKAMREAHRLARRFPEKQVMLLRMVKRLRGNEDGVKSLGSHMPLTKVDQLVPNPKRRPILKLNRKDGGANVEAAS